MHCGHIVESYGSVLLPEALTATFSTTSGGGEQGPKQAATLMQCTMYYGTPQQAKLRQDIAVQLGSPHDPTNSDRWRGIDPGFSPLTSQRRPRSLAGHLGVHTT